MAWVWWLLAPIATTVVGAIVIWWRAPTESGRLRRTDSISEHQALLHALAQKPSTVTSQPGAMHVGAADHPDH